MPPKKVYPVEKIVNHRMQDGVPQFRIKWLGYPSSQNTWESYDNIVDKNLIRDFYARTGKKPILDGFEEFRRDVVAPNAVPVAGPSTSTMAVSIAGPSTSAAAAFPIAGPSISSSAVPVLGPIAIPKIADFKIKPIFKNEDSFVAQVSHAEDTSKDFLIVEMTEDAYKLHRKKKEEEMERKKREAIEAMKKNQENESAKNK